MIFTRTKRTAQKVSDELAERGFKVGAVHGDLGQIASEKALKAFRTGDIDVLVATDVAARGIDIDDITHVINYQIPEDEQAYVHRIGRTGRAGKTGIAVTLVDWDELPRWTMIDKALGLDIPDPAETYSNSPQHLRRAGHPDRRHRSRSARRSAAGSAQQGPAEARETARRRAACAQPRPHPAAHPRRAIPGPATSRRPSRPRAGRRWRGRTRREGSGPARRRRRRRRPNTAAPDGRLDEAEAPLDGQTGTPHQGRPAGGSGDRRRSSPSPPD